jgi:hypothetical protein
MAEGQGKLTPLCPHSKDVEIGNLSTLEFWPQIWFQSYSIGQVEYNF